MPTLNNNQAQAVQKIRQESDNTYDLMRGCMNRMCITKDKQELDQMFISLTQMVNTLYQNNKRRLYIEETPEFDNHHTIEL